MTCRVRCQDPTCPCPDGDACHYEDLPGSLAMRPSWEQSVDVVALSRVYGFEVLDYGEEREGRGLLLAVGSGLLMATMDLTPACRWATDLSGGKPIPKMVDWCVWMSRLVDFVAVAAWFSITDPEFLRYGLEVIGSSKLAVYCQGANMPYGVSCSSLDGLARYVHGRWGNGRSRSQTGEGAGE